MRLSIGLVLTAAVLAGSISAQERPRVFVTDSQSWEMSGGTGGSSSGFGGGVKGGARPQTAEIIKTFTQKCKEVVVNNNRDRANYIAVLEHEGGKSWLRKDNKVAVFNQDGDNILGKSTMSLGGSVEEACKTVSADWEQHGRERAAMSAKPAPAAKSGSQLASSSAAASGAGRAARISVASTPGGADIEIDGAFVGSTPSSIELSSGQHEVVVRKKGFKAWQRRLQISGGDIQLAAELEPFETVKSASR